MRAEVEQAYEEGGDVYGPPAPAITVDQIVARTTNPGAGQSLQSMIIQNREQALERLRAGRDKITERRTRQQKSDESARWLAFAQGMLAPTQTGGFGETLGQTAGLLREENARSAESEAFYDEKLDMLVNEEIAIEAKAIDQLLTQVGHGNRAKGIHGTIQTMVDPRDKGKPVDQQNLVFGVMKLQEDGSWDMEALQDDDGAFFEPASKMDPARAFALIQAAERAEATEGRGQEMIDEAYEYRAPIRSVRRANAIFENAEVLIETSGIQALKNRLANFLGVDFGDTVELTELQMIAAQDYLDKLTELKGNTSDRDVREMKGISVGLGLNATANYRRLKEMELIYSTAIRKGIRESYQRGDMDAVGDLWQAADDNPWTRGARAIKGTKAAYDKLPPGTVFFIEGDWGGPMYTKPLEEE